MSKVKKIGAVEYEETYIEWKIADFFSIAEDEETERLHSPTFFFGDSDSWYLELYPKSTVKPEFMTLYLMRLACPNYSVEYIYGLKTQDGSVKQLFTGTLSKEQNVYNFCPIIKLTEILRRKCELAPSNVLTITCTLKRGTTYPTQINMLGQSKFKKLTNLDTLSENFKDLFLNKESCDITLRLGNNEYKAHKAILIARSSVFAAMFMHEMTEKQTGIINIPDCDPDSFEVFLEYLYCGKIEGLSFRTALRLYETSDKYDVQELKTCCTEYLMENLPPEKLCDVVIMADKYDDTEMLSAAQDYFTENLNKIFVTSEWERFLEENHRLANKLLKGMPKMKVAK